MAPKFDFFLSIELYVCYNFTDKTWATLYTPKTIVNANLNIPTETCSNHREKRHQRPQPSVKQPLRSLIRLSTCPGRKIRGRSINKRPQWINAQPIRVFCRYNISNRRTNKKRDIWRAPPLEIRSRRPRSDRLGKTQLKMCLGVRISAPVGTKAIRKERDTFAMIWKCHNSCDSVFILGVDFMSAGVAADLIFVLKAVLWFA